MYNQLKYHIVISNIRYLISHKHYHSLLIINLSSISIKQINKISNNQIYIESPTYFQDCILRIFKI